jgi:hypothetical protein
LWSTISRSSVRQQKATHLTIETRGVSARAREQQQKQILRVNLLLRSTSFIQFIYCLHYKDGNGPTTPVAAACNGASRLAQRTSAPA